MKLIFEKSKPNQKGLKLPKLDVPEADLKQIPEKFLRKSEIHLPEVAENEVVRHYIELSTKNYHIDKGFYPLGSCTMKYNPKINETTSSLPGFTNLHPFQPTKTLQGALALMYDLGEKLKEITGLQGITLQPSAGAHGEYTAIMMFKKYHDTKGNKHKNVILIPDSAHGTNPASVAISGLVPVTVKSDEKGMVDLADFESKLNENVAGMMITNPNTVGIFEKNIKLIAKKLHDIDALLYMDGANLNALLGIVRPVDIGFDAVHINLHKTFSTPHGGGGPGSGPVAVSEKLIPFLPLPQVKINEEGAYYLEWVNSKSIGKVHSFFGNFAILVRAYTYLLMQGKDGMKEISMNAIINANYLLAKLKDHFELGYKETPMHEFVLSGSKFKEQGVKVLDIAKRLLDYGFHAPTIYFPLIVHDALMIEPTESEPKSRLDEFAEAMIRIKNEIYENPELLLKAPTTTPVKRLDDAKAAREIDVNYFK
ncbi:MAG TPA: aminomethyl-transferring glycine dehydrogenase subunit GcvPB [Ignavibacteriales bacterium]|nr:aminomethyl-transferring glycine dehydrogenase subunit GcvPB [Ignavibacteriales bacterium]HOL80557.1 aminomethyl-transferring glycine dehydrogenase subunit GcvPB [Ignavibacteriales bacterium]HOM64246.1 aminomethyl-transferring glycine dehydrogenase subunit GcvPB [Ignavibacteriales bacterium]HPD67280.1 aminomethyl-transferring glycine dehydrogenase subunit GcvPB [Ignavibacteriales bacterium]HPP33108.1 aminomethyl-transferring glycine dehydrogenase subunit GcvPB [Ignavibacteriales bacterium]